MDDHSRLPEGDDAKRTEFDEADYRHHLDGLALDDGQASEYLRIVWDICRIFVECDMPPEIWGPILEPLTNPAIEDEQSVESSSD